MQTDRTLRDALARHFKAALDQPSDGQLIAAIAAGEKQAMSVLYARHNVAVYRFIVRIGRDQSLAEDLVSDVFLEVWRTADRFAERSKVSTWLLAIARNKVYSAFRRHTDAQLDEHFAATIEDPAGDPESELDNKDRSAAVRHCLTSLSPAHREIIDLVYYHEMSVEDVAEIVGIPASTVKTRMHYARNRLAELLKDSGVASV